MRMQFQFHVLKQRSSVTYKTDLFTILDRSLQLAIFTLKKTVDFKWIFGLRIKDFFMAIKALFPVLKLLFFSFFFRFIQFILEYFGYLVDLWQKKGKT